MAIVSERRDAEKHREPVELEKDEEADERLRDEEELRLPDAHLAARDRPRPRAGDGGVDVAVDDVVVGAAGAAHGDRTDQEEARGARGSGARPAASAASADDHQQGKSRSHQPIGRSSRASRA